MKKMLPLKQCFLRAVWCTLILGCSATVFSQDSTRLDFDGLQRIAPNNVALAPIEYFEPALALTSRSDLPHSPSSNLAQESAAATQVANDPLARMQPNPSQKQEFHWPVGTAAAPSPRMKGFSAAQPSGGAIAPQKQKRVRTIVIRVGAIVAASAALSTVIVLTEATPGKPPGAH